LQPRRQSRDETREAAWISQFSACFAETTNKQITNKKQTNKKQTKAKREHRRAQDQAASINPGWEVRNSS
jgi:hypothetical protein